MTFSRTSRVKTERKVCLKNGTDYQAVYEEGKSAGFNSECVKIFKLYIPRM